MTRAERVTMIARDRADLSVRRQCALLGLARAGVYREPAAPDGEELALMRWIDEQYLATPFYGSRRMTAGLRQAGHQVNRKRVHRLMRLMGLEALGPKPKTSRPSAQHRIDPYLLRGLTIDRPNQVGHRHHLNPDGPGVPLPGRGEGLVQPVRPGLASVEYDGHLVLPRRPRRRPEERAARDLQHRPGGAIHQHSIYRQAGNRRGADQHGRLRALVGQRLRRAAVAQLEVRRGPPEGLCQRSRGTYRHRPVGPLL